jgi:hypothetical protein
MMPIGEIKIKVIRPEPVHTPQCCMKVDPPTHANMWRRDRYKTLRPTFDPDLCQRESTVRIDGKPYCRIHAGGIALDRWIKGKLIEA